MIRFDLQYRFLIILTIFSVISCTGQSVFSRIISTPNDERVFDAAEDQYGNFYFVGYKAFPFTNVTTSYLLVLNNSGDILYENEYILEDTVSYFGNVFYRNDSIFILGAKGPLYDSLSDHLWILILNTDFEVLINKEYYINGNYLLDINTIVNSLGNFIVSGVVNLPDEQYPDMMFMEISPSGDSIQLSIQNMEDLQVTYDLIEDKNGGYKVFCYGYFPGSPAAWGNIVYLDDSLNYIEADSIPYSLAFHHSAKWLNDHEYLISGNKHFVIPPHGEMALIKMNSFDELIQADHYGQGGDTTTYVGAISNLDVIDSNRIFFGGTTNIYPTQLLFQSEYSWLMLTDLDSNLTLNWEKFYGGDAFYYLWGLKATSDGGCLLLSTRYDYLVQDFEMDIFILKVDSNGLLTGVDDLPTLSQDEILFAPNPLSGPVTIKFPGVSHLPQKRLVIFNSIGAQVFETALQQGGDRQQLDLSFLPSGIYFAAILSYDHRVASGKLLIAR